MKIERQRAGSVKRVVVLALIICAGFVLAWSWASVHFADDKVVSRTMEEIAADYYENYFYDRQVASYTVDGEVDLEQAFGGAAKRGFAEVLLRQLLLFDNGRWAEKRAIFVNDEFICDTNATGVTFTPVAPYGRTDYTARYSYSCQAK